jgi:hypothetical protein
VKEIKIAEIKKKKKLDEVSEYFEIIMKDAVSHDPLTAEKEAPNKTALQMEVETSSEQMSDHLFNTFGKPPTSKFLTYKNSKKTLFNSS